MTTMQQLSASQASPEVIINENFGSLSAAAIFSHKPETTSGLTLGIYGGLYNGNTKADTTVSLTNTSDNYVVVLRSTGVVSTSTTDTNSLDPLYAKLYKATCAGGVITVLLDQRWDANGLFFAPGAVSSQPLDSDLTTIAGLTATSDNFMQAKSSAWASRTPAQAAVDLQGAGLDVDMAGFRGIPQNSQSGNYTTVAADAGKHLYHPSGAGSGDTFTIDSNANVAYEVGTAITFVNMDSNTLAIAITSDTLYLAGTGSTGSRTLAQYGVATAIKLTSTVWVISGTGLI